jgi:Regulatory subunit of type II PKA R-subunit
MSSEALVGRKSSTSNTELYKVKLPVGLKLILEDLTREAIRKQPKNLDIFFADFFNQKLEERARGRIIFKSLLENKQKNLFSTDLGPGDFRNFLGPEESNVKRKKKTRGKKGNF